MSISLINSIKAKPFQTIFVIMLLGSIIHFHNAGDKVAGDGYSYFLYCRNLFFYGDLKYHAEDALIQNTRFQSEMSSGVIKNPFSIGPAIFWLPFYAIAHGVISIENIWQKKSLNGFEYVYREYIGHATIIYIFIGLWLLFKLLLMKGNGIYESTLSIVLGYFGTFLINYAIYEPSMAHGISFFLVSLYLFLWEKYRNSLNIRKVLFLGIVLGFAMDVRYTNVTFAVIPLIDTLANPKNKLITLALFATGMVAGFSPQMFAWYTSFGKYLLVPQGQGFMNWLQPHLLEVLFSYAHGLFSSQILIILGIAGYIAGNWKDKNAVLSMIFITVALIYINSATYDWYAGHSFGARRFEALLPFVILGVPVALQTAEKIARKRSVVILFSLLLLFYNLLYLDIYRKNRQLRDHIISPSMVIEHGYAYFGSIINFPINLVLSIRYQLPLGKSEMLIGNYPTNGLIRPAIDKEYLLDGWELSVSDEEGVLYRQIDGKSARLGFALLENRDRDIEIQLARLSVIKNAEVVIYINNALISRNKIDGDTIKVKINRSQLNYPFNIMKIECSEIGMGVKKININ